MDMGFPFLGSFIDKSSGFGGRYELYQMKVKYSEIFNKVLGDHRDEISVERDLMKSWSENEKLERVAEKVFASRCSSSFV